MKTVSFVAASSNSGKTTLIEKLVPLLKRKGLRVAVIKHASKGFDIDPAGKDSRRFRDAGADEVLVAGPDALALIRRVDREPTREELERMVADADIVLTEGFKRDAAAKIEVFRSGLSADEPMCLRDRSFLALVSDRRIDAGIPWFSPDDAQGVVDFLAAKFQL